MKKIILISALSALSLVSCNKKDDNTKTSQPTQNKVEIHISNPKPGEMFDPMDTIWIDASITASESIHGYTAMIKQLSNDSILYEKNEHAHGKEITIKDFWVNRVVGMQDVKLVISAILNHQGQQSSSEIQFHCHGH